ncbi:Uncharacterized protein Fot_11672 [Forsythia ovata]|uniref:Uncharacterized protein n=1 Tax=Forsythia ovata TaxID=205694 RepID=A0ABD1WKR8_9LAMI
MGIVDNIEFIKFSNHSGTKYEKIQAIIKRQPTQNTTKLKAISSSKNQKKTSSFAAIFTESFQPTYIPISAFLCTQVSRLLNQITINSKKIYPQAQNLALCKKKEKDSITLKITKVVDHTNLSYPCGIA